MSKSVKTGSTTSDYTKIGKEDALYAQFRPEPIWDSAESVEWSMCYAYDARDTATPRLLLIGHSIEQSIHGYVRQKIAGCMTLTFWAGSRCVTNKDYFRELSEVLNQARADVICFGNGGHRPEDPDDLYEAALRQALAFIRAAKPQAKLFVISTTPSRTPEKDVRNRQRNQILSAVAADFGATFLNAYAHMDPLDRDRYWFDTAHYKPEGQKILGDWIAESILKEVNFADTGKAITVQPGQSDYDRNQQILDTAVLDYCKEKE